MTVKILPGYTQQIIAHTLTELAARKQREEVGARTNSVDIVDWSQRHFFIPQTQKPIVLLPHEKAILRFWYTRQDNRHYPFQNMIYSSIKKSGKSTVAGVVARYIAETQTRYGEIYAVGNDWEQAKERSFKEIKRSLELTPGYQSQRDRIPGRWYLSKTKLTCLLTGSAIRAIPVDAAGEAGGQPSLSVWTELWGAESQEAKQFWEEMTPVLTVPDSQRLVETYAGYKGDSALLESLYDRGLIGHQLTTGELAAAVCREDVPGETFEDFVYAWHEAKGDPTHPIPVWTDGRFCMYWDSGLNARRMPWQHDFVAMGRTKTERLVCAMCRQPKAAHEQAITASEYYQEEEKGNPPQAYRRLHLNEWVGAEGSFVPMEQWDACGRVHKVTQLVEGDNTQLVEAADAATTGDCFGIVAVSRCPHDSEAVDIRGTKKWDPKEMGHPVDHSEPEAVLRTHAKIFNLVQIAFDSYQLTYMMQRLQAEGVAWCDEFSQAGLRLIADRMLYDMIMARKVHYDGESGQFADLREHINNCNVRVEKDNDSRMRLVKKPSGKKIDLAVALSMANYRCRYLLLSPGT